MSLTVLARVRVGVLVLEHVLVETSALSVAAAVGDDDDDEDDDGDDRERLSRLSRATIASLSRGKYMEPMLGGSSSTTAPTFMHCCCCCCSRCWWWWSARKVSRGMVLSSWPNAVVRTTEGFVFVLVVVLVVVLVSVVMAWWGEHLQAHTHDAYRR